MNLPAIAVDGIAASRKRIKPFRVFRPESVTAVCELLAARPDALLHAGGIDLVSRMKAGLGAPALIALGQVASLKGVRRNGDALEIGAATSHWQIEHDGLVRSCLPALADYVAGLGNVRVRLQGTIGGNIMAAEPGYEIPALLAALDARLIFASRADGRRYTVAAREFRPVSAPHLDLLVTISIPLAAREIAWSRDLRPVFGVVAALDFDGDTIRSGYGATTGQGPIADAIAIERPLPRRELPSQARALAERWAQNLSFAELSTDLDPAYARHVLSVLMRRLLLRIVEDPR